MEVVHVHQSLGSFTEGLNDPFSGQSTVLLDQRGHSIPTLRRPDPLCWVSLMGQIRRLLPDHFYKMDLYCWKHYRRAFQMTTHKLDLLYCDPCLHPS